MLGAAKLVATATSIMAGIGAFMLIQLFAGLYLHTVEWLFGGVDSRRLVFAGGLVLGFVIAEKALGRLCLWMNGRP